MTKDQLRELEQLRCPICGDMAADIDERLKLCCCRLMSLSMDAEHYWPAVLSALRRAEELLGPVGKWGTP